MGTPPSNLANQNFVLVVSDGRIEALIQLNHSWGPFNLIIVGGPPISGRVNEISKMGPEGGQVGKSRKRRLAPPGSGGGQSNISDVPLGGAPEPPSNYALRKHFR